METQWKNINGKRHFLCSICNEHHIHGEDTLMFHPRHNRMSCNKCRSEYSKKEIDGLLAKLPIYK